MVAGGHNIAINVPGLHCWCYACDDLVVPPLFERLARNFEAEGGSGSGASSGANGGASLQQPSKSSLANRAKMTRSAVTHPPPGVVGLYNLGNSCYMNAAIQAILAVPSIMGFFQSPAPAILATRRGNRRISEAMAKLVEAIHSAKMAVLSPTRLVREVKLVNPMFHGYTQQDTMDFVRCIFERVHDELRTRMSPGSADGNLERPAAGGAVQRGEPDGVTKKATADRQEAFRSIISDTFGGVMRSEILCLTCKNISIKDEPFFDISVQLAGVPDVTALGGKPSHHSSGATTSLSPTESHSSLASSASGNVRGASSGISDIAMETVTSHSRPSSPSGAFGGLFNNIFSSIGESMGMNGKPVLLESCIASFCAPERLDGRDRYRCERCATLVPSQKTLRFKSLPQTLCIQIKRFKHESYFSSKLSTHVIAPLDEDERPLEMGPFMCEHGNGGEQAPPSAGQGTQYAIAAIIGHRGTFGGGHYVAYCKHPALGCWLEFDDATISIVPEGDVAKVQAYVLFYRLLSATPEEASLQTHAVELVSRGLARTSVTPPDDSMMNDASSEAAEGDGGEGREDDAKEEPLIYISREWINRLCTLTWPGPLDNGEFMCAHGGLQPDKAVEPLALLHGVSSQTYDELVGMYGVVSDAPPLVETRACAICLEEERILDERRAREEQQVQALDTSTIKGDEVWFLISSEWLISWGQFKNGLAGPPGPISNEILLAPLRGASPASADSTDEPTMPDVAGDGDQRPRSNLSRGTHYRGINSRVWKYFLAAYGGGPPIIRKSINIYGPPSVDPEESSGSSSPPLPSPPGGGDDVFVDVVGQ